MSQGKPQRYRPSPYCFAPIRELPLLSRGKPYFVKSLYEGEREMMFILADMPTLAWPASLFSPCNDAELDSLREALKWIDPNVVREEQKQMLKNEADDIAEKWARAGHRVLPKPLPPLPGLPQDWIGKRIQNLRIRMPKDWKDRNDG